MAYQTANFAYQGAGQFAYQEIPSAPAVDQFPGWLTSGYKRRPSRRDVVLGALPAEQEQIAQGAVQDAAKAAKSLSSAQPETQAATDALEAERKAEALFVAVYLAAYPILEREAVLEAYRQELMDLAEEEAFVMFLAMQ